MENDSALQEDIRSFGARLATLLAVADIPDDQKEAWATLVPEMTPPELEKLAAYLTSRVPESIRLEAETFLRDLSTVQETYEKGVAEADAKANAELDALAEELNEAEKIGKLKEDVLSD